MTENSETIFNPISVEIDIDEQIFPSDSVPIHNPIDDNNPQFMGDDFRSAASNDEHFNMELDKLDSDLQLKPQHWSDEYWNTILMKYRWFIYKEEHAGCKICRNTKLFMGKKSQLATMKLYIMNLSYEEFELKLSTHNLTSQHQRSITVLNRRFHGQDESISSVAETDYQHPESLDNQSIVAHTPKARGNRPPITESMTCPQCNKFYKFKKSFVAHVLTCTGGKQGLDIALPCNCPTGTERSLLAVDHHMEKFHHSNTSFICKFCHLQTDRTTALFEHLFVQHGYCWDPAHEFPEVANKSSNARSANHENIDCNTNRSKTMQLKAPSVRRQFKEVPQMPVKTADASNDAADDGACERNYFVNKSFSVPLTEVVVCSVCDGRYLNQKILDEHNEKYHANEIGEERMIDNYDDCN